MTNHNKELEELILNVINEGGSDLHLSVDHHPIIRVSGDLFPLLKKPKLTKDDTMAFLSALVTEEKKKNFMETQEVDFSYSFQDKARFRGNAFFKRVP